MKRPHQPMGTVVLFMLLAIIWMPLSGKALAADLEIDDRSGQTGGQVIFTVSVNNAPNAVTSLGVDISFDPAVLEYLKDSEDFTGTLLEAWSYKTVNNYEAGTLRFGGFDLTGFPSGTSGALVKLTFTVIAAQGCQLTMESLVNGFTGWTMKNGTFTPIILPTVTTQDVSSVMPTTATGNGNITGLGSPNPTQHGVCWNTTGSPTIAGSKTEEGPAGTTGAFTSNMTGLSPNTNYYVKGYAAYGAETAYGGQVSFSTPTLSILYVSGSDATCGGNNPCYTSIQEAINVAYTGDDIRIAEGIYGETFVLNAEKLLILKGGWDAAFQSQSSGTTIIKAPSASQGSLTLQMVTIRPL